MMTPTSGRDGTAAPRITGDALDDYVRAFEVAYSGRGGVDPAAYLPPRDHPLHSAVLRELVRVDLEYGWERGCPKDLAAYQRAFPALTADAQGLREIAFEEFRLRRQAGQDPAPEEYLARYGVRIDPEAGRSRPLGPTRLDAAGGRVPAPSRAGRGAPNGDGHSLTSTRKDAPDGGPAPAMPEVGDLFLGFRLVGELGHGSFGRVYLARQGDLADRAVVLKVTVDGLDESQTLAQLQHENIVPVYSRHREGRLRAVCMPYLGSVTLRDVVDDLKGQGALPESGRGLLSSLGKGSARRGGPAGPGPSPGSSAGAGAAGAGAGAGRAEAGAPADAGDYRAILGGLTYVEAVVWMAARLADGLAHAHERGILHRDMKPANVLLTDDGRPMLLDFNLSEDLKLRADDGGAPAGVGGTLPYMAPEHLAAFRDGGRGVDARSDLYAFGVILFEMLTGRPPFPVRDGVRPDVIRSMIADRRGPPPRLRPWNPAVSPAVESVVRRCLDPDPAGRYGSARELGEDLQRHLAHRPLRHAPDPSRSERASKWARRNRRPLAAAVVLAAVAAVVGGFALVLAARTDRLDRLEAWAAAGRFRERSTAAIDLVHSTRKDEDPARWREGQAAIRQALGEFRALDDPAHDPWWGRRPADRLPAPDLARVRGEVGELLLLLGYAEARDGDRATDPAARGRLWRDAVRHNEAAERSFRPGGVPRSVWVERAALFERLGEPAASAAAAGRAKSTPPAGAADFTFMGCEAGQRGRYAEALPLLEEAVRLAPERYWTWLALGNCQAGLRHDDQATACYTTCVALRPELPTAWFNRGLVLHRRKKPAQALADYQRALALRPDDPRALTNGALAALDLGRDAEALRGLDRAIALGTGPPRLYLMRAEARRRLGDPAGARRDRDEGVRREPVDERGWNARAMARANDRDDLGALADLDRALAINPVSYATLVNRSCILAGRLGRTPEAVEALDRVVRAYPDQAEAWSDRAVLLARLGRRDAALSDAERALEIEPLPLLQYKAACAYALTSLREPGDRLMAVQHLASALRRDHRLADLVDTDTDLDPIRDDPRFPPLLSRARSAARPPHPETESRP